MREVATTPTEALRILWKERFFFAEKNKGQVKERFKKLGYNFDDDALGMALLRAKFLTKRGAKGNYSYVQTYPFVEEKSRDK